MSRHTARATARLGALALLALVCTAHVGSPDAWYEGPAGPYRVLVHVQVPAVVPGIAVINVQSADATRVTAFVNKYDATGATPPPDVAQPVTGNPGWYRTQLWVMAPGSNGVTVHIDGARGAGTVTVPVTVVAARRLAFGGPLVVGLIVVGAFLAAGLFTLIGATVREGVLPPGAEPDDTRRRRARWAMARAVGVVALALAGMGVWWHNADASFANTLFSPLAVTAEIDTTAHPPRLTMTIGDSVWAQRNTVRGFRARGQPQLSGLVEDHGKLVHLFLIAADGRSAFAHLHPVTTDTVAFTAPLPPLPPGTYHMFADLVHESGFAETLTAVVEVPAVATTPPARATGDADDSWEIERSGAESRQVTLDDGSTMTWLPSAAPLVANAEAALRFAVQPSRGDAAGLEPYLGMSGHAAVVRDDGKVFIHLHPLGTISLAAQSQLASATRGENAMQAMPGMSATIAPSDTVYFPYAFPQPGTYYVWVQVKRRGRVLTGVFRAVVLSG